MQKKSEIEKFLRKKAKELKSDWNDVPTWVIDACNEFITKSQPSDNDKMIDKAAEYLVPDNNISVEEMVQNIIDHRYPHEFIDEVNDVTVWDKVEMEFTCKQFLELIGYKQD